MNRQLLVELALAARAPSAAATAAVERRRSELTHAPPLDELLEVAARARGTGATDEELGLALEALCALYAPPAGACEH